MISEVVNALFVTYIASEYIIADDNATCEQQQRKTALQQVQRLLLPLLLLSTINVLDRVTGATEILNNLLQTFLHLPRILFASLSFLVALYLDVRHLRHRRNPTLPPVTLPIFLSRVGRAFLMVLPAYPILAVLISFGFMFVIRLWEVLGLPEEWLNAPIYYGVLYGPFGWVYTTVKRQLCHEAVSLPL